MRRGLGVFSVVAAFAVVLVVSATQPAAARCMSLRDLLNPDDTSCRDYWDEKREATRDTITFREYRERKALEETLRKAAEERRAAELRAWEDEKRARVLDREVGKLEKYCESHRCDDGARATIEKRRVERGDKYSPIDPFAKPTPSATPRPTSGSGSGFESMDGRGPGGIRLNPAPVESARGGEGGRNLSDLRDSVLGLARKD